MGAFALREGGSCERGREFLCIGKLPHRWDQGGAEGSQKAGQSRDLDGRIQKMLHFSAHKQLTDLGSNQTAGSGNLEKCIEATCN